MGLLVRGPPEYTIEKLKELIDEMEPVRIIAVGDRVSSNLAKKRIAPHVLIVDNKIMRRSISPIEVDADQTLHVRNPAGTITDEAWQVIKEALKQEKRIKIVVDGEEDLLTLVAVLCAPENSVVVYGQPREGAVMIKVTKETKEMASELVDKMEWQGQKS